MGKNTEKENNGLQKTAEFMGASHAVNTGVKAGIKEGIKSFLNNVSQAVSNGINSITGALKSVGQFVGNAVKSAGQFISNGVHAMGNMVQGAATAFYNGCAAIASSLSVSTTAVTTVATTASVSTVAVTVVAIATLFMPARTDTYVNIDCSVEAKEKMSNVSYSSENIDENIETNAKKVYSVLKTAGFNEVQIAGVLGNFTAEGNFDPTSVENIFDEPYRIGTKKQQAIDCNFNTHIYCPDYAYQYDFPAGVGIAGYTGQANTNLMEFARANNKDWYDIDVQIAFAISDAYDPNTHRWLFDTYMKTNYGNAGAATEAFMRDYERPANYSSLGHRQTKANEWLARMADWVVDTSYGNSIISMSGTAANNGTTDKAKAIRDSCAKYARMRYDNSSIASAAVSYAYATKDEGNGNNGTELYQRVHDNVYPGDIYYMSCDRGVACAVRWSGADDDYPPGSVSPQFNYLSTSPNWKKVDMRDTNSPDEYEPGDVIIENGQCHTLMYVGNEAISIKYPQHAGTSYCLVSASFEERSPGCQMWYSCGDRHVFRNVKKTENSKYTSAGDGVVKNE